MSVVNALVEIFQSSGFVSLSWQNWVMILVSFVLLYLAIVKKFEPLLLVPIASVCYLLTYILILCMIRL